MRLVQPDVFHHCMGGVYILEMHLHEPGAIIVTHKHTYDHFAILGSGEVEVQIDGITKRVVGPSVIKIEAHKNHAVLAITDVVWFCVHAVPSDLNDETAISYMDEVLVEN